MSDEIKTAQDKARELGEYIASTGLFSAFRETHEQLRGDTEAIRLLDEHAEVFNSIRKAEQEGSPVEPEDKHRLMDLQQKLHENAVLQEYARKQADFQELMNAVTDGIHGAIHIEPIGEPDGNTD
jgi:cell fate (sporulation/competence/biofilm development) regulator YlbF (YheA/YmcA/DUF963 family)